MTEQITTDGMHPALAAAFENGRHEDIPDDELFTWQELTGYTGSHLAATRLKNAGFITHALRLDGAEPGFHTPQLYKTTDKFERVSVGKH